MQQFPSFHPALIRDFSASSSHIQITVEPATEPPTEQSPEAGRPPLLVKLTGYRLLVVVVTIVLGTAKLVLIYRGQSLAPTWLDFTTAVLLALVFWYLGLYENVTPPVATWFFHTDHTRVVHIVVSFLAYGLIYSLCTTLSSIAGMNSGLALVHVCSGSLSVAFIRAVSETVAMLVALLVYHLFFHIIHKLETTVLFRLFEPFSSWIHSRKLWAGIPPLAVMAVCWAVLSWDMMQEERRVKYAVLLHPRLRHLWNLYQDG